MTDASSTSPAAEPSAAFAAHPAGLQRWQLLIAFYIGVPVSIALIFGWMGATRTAGWDRTLAISYWLVMNFSGWWLTDLASRASAIALRPWNPPLWLVLTTGYLAHGPAQVWAARHIIVWFESHLPPDVPTKPLPTWGLEQAIDNFMPGIITWLVFSYLFYAWLGLPRYGFVPPRAKAARDAWETAPPRSLVEERATAAREERGAVVAPSLRLPGFVQRLPEEIRAPVLALEAEQHYLRVYTEKGRDLILFRFSDAVGEMAETPGAQVHRSWWVARSAVERAVKESGAWRLVLRDRTEVPVSRTYVLAAKQAGLIES
jgi:hypothetical protein